MLDIKRIFDILLAIFLIVPAVILILLAAIFIRIETPGSAIFKQARIGHQGQIFILYKLRTMYITTANRASHEIMPSNISNVGHFLRRTKIDELPQIWSVLKGDMSFVGPRPCLPQQEELLQLRKERGALNVRPGITGPAQIMGIDMSTPDKLSMVDAAYAKDHKFFTDLKIIIATATGKGRGDAIK